jgi:Tfp pilus assembly protein FimV
MAETHVVTDSGPGEVAADTAALAANSAERAQAAAADAIANAQVAAAGVASQAAEEIRSTQEGLNEWQTSIQARNAELAENLRAHVATTDQRLKETADQLSLILSRLDKPPENPGSPGQEPSGETPPAAAEPAAEPAKPAERRRAHRWI